MLTRLVLSSLVLMLTSAASAEEKAKAPEMTPPQEVTAMAASMAGTWTCSGKAEIRGQVRDDGKAKVTHKAVLGGYWIQSSLNIAMPGLPAVEATMLTTYDAGAKKWFRTTANSRGAHMTLWGVQNGTKLSWEGDAYWGPRQVKLRAVDEQVSAKEAHLTAEYSEDGGQTWKFDHDVVCKK